MSRILGGRSALRLSIFPSCRSLLNSATSWGSAVLNSVSTSTPSRRTIPRYFLTDSSFSWARAFSVAPREARQAKSTIPPLHHHPRIDHLNMGHLTLRFRSRLEGQNDADDQAKERGPFEQRRNGNHIASHIGSHFRLARHALQR